MSFKYPDSELQQPQKFLEKVGTLWSDVYAGRQLLQTRAEAIGALFRDCFRLLEEAQNCLSVADIPVWHTREWWPIRMRQSELTSGDANLPRYDESGLYYDQSGLAYDVVLKTQHAIPLPDDIVDIDLLCNRLTNPSVVMVKGLDFSLDSSRILFLDDPFENENIATQPIFEDNQVSDQEILLWAFQAKFDKELIYRHFGYILGLQLESSPEYKQVVKQLLHAISGGTSTISISQLIAAASGLPIVQERVEKVEDVYNDTKYRYVVTDRNVYRFPVEHTPAASIGDNLRQGDPVSDALLFDDWSRGELDPAFPSLVLEPGLLDPQIQEPLAFANTDLPVTVSDGEVTFPVSGTAADVTKFWELVRAREASSGLTLETVLKNNNNGAVPSTINPAKFLVENIFRNNARGIRIKVATTAEKLTDLVLDATLRRILPPHVFLFLLLELPALDDSATMADTAGITQDEMDPMSDTAGPEFAETDLTSSYNSIVCT